MLKKLLVGFAIIGIVYTIKPLLPTSTPITKAVITPTPTSAVSVSPSVSPTPKPISHPSIIRPGDGGEGFDN